MRRHHPYPFAAGHSRAVERLSHKPGWPVRGAGSSFAHHALSILVVLVPLAIAVVVGVAMWRLWSRRRLAAGGSWFEVRLGELVSRAAIEALMRTLAGGLRRPLLVKRHRKLSVDRHRKM